ncbi:GNAT family N-acetyltransferase [Lysinibacillus louembei]|uniref:GNAT family N-acetyltransferase n=1 Tax=Lysinibacillus louembei TaxID=1470088 RepID=A0ABZ0RUG0_9BACI|nr:GNAT family N-acetyltransferase [Lysinibacillus louembei]WPK11775.1 GNAT family N-acetyltransferase [Lysinibacillus louembei]
MIRMLTASEQLPMDLLLLADPSEEIVTEYVQRGFCYVDERDGEIVGVYVLLPTRPHTMELVNVAIDERWQGQGIGKQLVLHAIERAKAMHFKTIQLGTGNSSVDQLALYQKCGFRIVGVDRDFFLQHYDEPIFENGIQCIDMIRLELLL